MGDRVDRTERLLNLVFALMGAARAVPRAVIRDTVPGYAEAASESAFERMFERDKDELRSMGIPVETVTDDLGEVLGYRITRDAYAMADLDLTVAERAAIAIASSVWGSAALGAVAGTAARKIEAALGTSDSWDPEGLTSNIALTSADAALLPLMQAIRTDRVVTFAYQAPAAPGPQRRTLSPWRLLSTEGHWRVTGWDHDRNAERTFRVSRIVGAVSVTAQTRSAPPATHERQPVSADTGVRAIVDVHPHRGATLRRARVQTGDLRPSPDLEEQRFEVKFSTMDALIGAVLAAGPDARVISPPEVIALVVEHLERIDAAHSGEPA